jgi:hypothetical protein
MKEVSGSGKHSEFLIDTSRPYHSSLPAEAALYGRSALFSRAERT